LAARFFSSLLSYFAADAVPFPCVSGAGPPADRHANVRFPAPREVPRILDESIDVDLERALGSVAPAKRIIDQLKIGSTSFAESLGFQ
jgi:hypothetical protein